MMITEDVKRRAHELGFVGVGVAPADPLVEHERVLSSRIADGMLAGLSYFRPERVPLATDPRALLSGARAVLSLALPYAGPSRTAPPAGLYGRVAGYARGRDYHLRAKEKLAALVAYIGERVPGAGCRSFVDATPLSERAFAAQAGLGWFGKNNCLVTPTHGSWVVLCEVLTEAPLAADEPLAASCGDCRACLAACPTGALEAPYVHRTSRCLSYLTTELKGPLPRELRPLLGQRVLGCDSCQSACPRNAALPTSEPREEPSEGLDDWLELASLFALSEAQFRERFQDTAAARPRRRGLLRNVAVVLGNLGNRDAVPTLARALADLEPLVRGHAAWALGRLGGAVARRQLERVRRQEVNPAALAEVEAALGEGG
ncbi:MAG: tRNA epoxyqueuosine(34) reductase QueG [Dehalococcoidales bacterium]|nr:tRNA epoxyqueuosine(34) reductase QueG [Dehalococcoidales bacterium]